ncbi:hypothetical protein F4778DRAFT_748930 [Xylariomycetidae sp. FL2044]|nr:hypothetical protein F4778DRAFT_748930 [Xylariomycetidae sp. FL2044]
MVTICSFSISRWTACPHTYLGRYLTMITGCRVLQISIFRTRPPELWFPGQKHKHRHQHHHQHQHRILLITMSGEKKDFLQPVVSAAERNDAPELARLLDQWEAADPGQRSPSRETGDYPLIHFHPALNRALELGNVAAAECLLRRGARAHRTSLGPLLRSTRNTPEPNFKSFDVLLRHGWDPNWRFGPAGDALIGAIKGRKPALVRYLLENGADPNRNSSLGCSPLEHACQPEWADAEIRSLLIARGAKVTARSEEMLAAQDRRGS